MMQVKLIILLSFLMSVSFTLHSAESTDEGVDPRSKSKEYYLCIKVKPTVDYCSRKIFDPRDSRNLDIIARKQMKSTRAPKNTKSLDYNSLQQRLQYGSHTQQNAAARTPESE